MKKVQMVAIDKIRVINGRARSDVRFQEMVTNVSTVGLKKPITVSCRAEDDGYDLVCGQGRLEAYLALGQTEVPAIVVDVPLHDRYLMSLVENLARPPRTTLQLAREIHTLRERGYATSEIATKVGLSDTYVSHLARLLSKGETRLVEAVERGEIPIGVAIEIANADDQQIQRSLTEAYESGKLKGKALLKVRRLIETRRLRGQAGSPRGPRQRKAPSADDVIRTYKREAQRQERFVKQARAFDRQLRFVVSALKRLFEDENLVHLLRAEALDGVPKYIAEAIRK
jgi:ParB family transcriptional regulator, chromosome partitioning protein